jgi:hypothetical protein
MTLRIYNLTSALVDKVGKIIQPWNTFFQQFTQKPQSASVVTASASPFTYTAGEPGQLTVIGGAITSLVLARGSVTVNITGQKQINLEIGDSLTIIYTGLPTITFFSRY